MPAPMLRTVSWLGLAAIALASATVVASGPAIKVTLLGTGCPPAVMNRFGPATLVEAGLVFTRTKPRLAVYSHVCLPGATEQDLVPPTRKHYAGPLEVGEDLMVVEVGEDISVRRPALE